MDVVWLQVTYYNAKLLDANLTGFASMDFVKDPRFQSEEVNLTYSTVHVPTNIFNRCEKASGLFHFA